MIEIPYSENKLDMMILSKVGGYIVLKAKGDPVFRFDTKEQFDRYLEMKKNGGIFDAKN